MGWGSRQLGGRLIVGLLAWVALTVPVGAEEAFGPLTAQDQGRIDEGEIVVQVEKTSEALKSFRAIGLVKAPVERIYAAVTDFDRYADLFKIKEAKVVNRQGSHLWVHAVIGLPWPVGDRWVTNETILSPETTSFAYQRREGSILRYEGTLRVVSRGPSLSQVYYAAKGDPGIPLIPSWLLNQFQARLLPDSIQRIRNSVER